MTDIYATGTIQVDAFAGIDENGAESYTVNTTEHDAVADVNKTELRLSDGQLTQADIVFHVTSELANDIKDRVRYDDKSYEILRIVPVYSFGVLKAQHIFCNRVDN